MFPVTRSCGVVIPYDPFVAVVVVPTMVPLIFALIVAPATGRLFTFAVP